MINNKFKVFILSLFLLFTGCTANYEVEIKDDKVLETFTVINPNKSSWSNDLGGLTYEQLIDIYSENPPKVYGYLIYGGDDPEEDIDYDSQEEVKNKETTIDPTYESKKILTSSELGVSLSYNFDIDKYKDSSVLDHYLTNLSVEHTEDNILKIYATPEWKIFSKYPTLENMKVSILGDSISTFYKEGSEMNSYYTGTNQFYYPTYSATVKSVDLTWWYKLIKNNKITISHFFLLDNFFFA